MSGRLWSSQLKYVAQSVPFTYGRNKYKKSICWNVPCAQGHGPTNTDSDTKRAGNIKFNYKKSDERINILPHELESGNHSQKLSEHMMDQDHQRQILIQHLMYHLTYPATERQIYYVRTRIHGSNLLAAILRWRMPFYNLTFNCSNRNEEQLLSSPSETGLISLTHPASKLCISYK